MTDADALFARYARERLQAEPFLPEFNKPEEQIFAASLASTTALLGGIRPARNGRRELLAVAPGFVETMTPNAFADRHGETHVIGMHVALLVTIADFALYAFTQRDFFPSIGNAADEDSPPPASGEAPGLFLLDRTLQDSAINAATDRHRVPKDADRHVVAVYLAILMARFVWLHEWSHCANGHVDFLHARQKGTRLCEVPELSALVGVRAASRAERELREMQHAMELEADRTAFEMSLGIQRDDQESIPGIRALGPTVRMELAAIGALLMAWLFEEYQRYMDTHAAVTHPAPRDRLATLAAHAKNALEIMAGDAAWTRLISSYEALRARLAAMPGLDGLARERAMPEAFESQLAPYRYESGS